MFVTTDSGTVRVTVTDYKRDDDRTVATTTINENSEPWIKIRAQKDDIMWDFLRGWIQFPQHESLKPGHVFMAFQVAGRHQVEHISELYCVKVRPN